MPTIVEDCPRCGAHNMTFDVLGDVRVGFRYDWQNIFEIFAACRRCSRPSIMRIEQAIAGSEARGKYTTSGAITALDGDLAGFFEFDRIVSIADFAAKPAPDDLPDQIASAFSEGTRSLAIGCHNAAGTMFRLCLDLATEDLLPPEADEGGPSRHQRRNLAPRLAWLFEHGRLQADLRDLSNAVKANGDDGAHRGELDEAEAEDIYDFAFALLERLYTQPARLAAAAKRREARQAQPKPATGDT